MVCYIYRVEVLNIQDTLMSLLIGNNIFHAIFRPCGSEYSPTIYIFQSLRYQQDRLFSVYCVIPMVIVSGNVRITQQTGNNIPRHP